MLGNAEQERVVFGEMQPIPCERNRRRERASGRHSLETRDVSKIAIDREYSDERQTSDQLQ